MKVDACFPSFLLVDFLECLNFLLLAVISIIFLSKCSPHLGVGVKLGQFLPLWFFTRNN